MENVITERVKKASLTRTQLKIAEYFIQNPERIGRGSSLEVARKIGVSDASITRFARAIGYKGFSDLKNDIYNSMARQASGGMSGLSLAERFDVNRAQNGSRVSRSEYMKTLQYNLERTFLQNVDEAFDAVAAALVGAEHRYIVGFRGCLGVAVQFAWLLRVLADHVTSISDEGPGGVGSMQSIGAGDCALFFSVSRYYKSDLMLMKLARRRGAKICVVTDSVLSPLAREADVTLTAETRHMSFFNSMAALNMISEYLLTIMAAHCAERCRARAEERDELTRDLLL